MVRDYSDVLNFFLTNTHASDTVVRDYSDVLNFFLRNTHIYRHRG